MGIYKSIYKSVYGCGLVYTYISLLCQLRDTTVAMGTARGKILISNATLHKKEPGFLGEMTDSRTEEGNIQDELEHLVEVQKVRRCLKK